MGEWIKASNWKRPKLEHGDIVKARLFDGSETNVLFQCCQYEYWWYYADRRKGEPPVEFYKAPSK